MRQLERLASFHKDSGWLRLQPKRTWFLLECGHPSWYFDWEKKPAAATGYFSAVRSVGRKSQRCDASSELRAQRTSTKWARTWVAALFGECDTGT